MLRRWLPPILGPILVGVGAGLASCGGSSSETPFPLEPDLAMLDAAGPPRGAEYVVFTGQSAEPEPEPPPERTRQPIPEPEPEPEPLVPDSPDASVRVDAGFVIVDAGPRRDAGRPRDASVDGSADSGVTIIPPRPRVTDAGVRPPPGPRPPGFRDASHD